MKDTFKRSAMASVFALAAVWTCLAQNASYTALLAKAKEYEAKKQYIYALGTYWDAMEADYSANGEEAYKAYLKLGHVIRDGKMI